MNAFEFIDQVPEIAGLIALELRKLSSPNEDQLSQNQAFQRFGRAWIEKYVESGDLHRERKGGKMLFSLSEIERVRTKEAIAARNRKRGAGLVFSHRKKEGKGL